MTISEGASLLTFLDAPVMVGDPEGRVIYVNPAFERRFDWTGAEVQGELLASLFSGGAREAMLGAVARVCEFGSTERFRLREGGAGYLALVSAIRGEGEQLGAVILLTDEPLADERVMVFHREMQEPLEEVRGCLEELLEQTGGRRSEVHRQAIETGMRALDRARKWSSELHGVLVGREAVPAKPQGLDPVSVLREVVSRMEPELASLAVTIDLLLPVRLPQLVGDASRLETALVHWLRRRCQAAPANGVFTLSARPVGPGETSSIVISVVEPPGCGDPDGDHAPSPAGILEETVSALGGRVHVTGSPRTGWVATVALAQAA